MAYDVEQLIGTRSRVKKAKCSPSPSQPGSKRVAGSLVAEFSWGGVDEGDRRSGRGWVAPGTAGRLVGHLYFLDRIINSQLTAAGY